MDKVLLCSSLVSALFFWSCWEVPEFPKWSETSANTDTDTQTGTAFDTLLGSDSAIDSASTTDYEGTAAPSDSDSDSGSEQDIGTDSTSSDIEECECIIRVDIDSKSALPDGSSWVQAYTSIQDGIGAAHEQLEDDPALQRCCVWVAEGTYHIYTDGPEDTVQLESPIDLLGGFAGDEKSAEERDASTRATVLSGRDKGGQNRVDAVVTVTGNKGPIRFEGFIVIGGGAGMELVGASPAISNCTFTQNSAGGLRSKGGSPVIRDCVLSYNSAEKGGGLFLDGGAPIVESSWFIGNTAHTDAVDVMAEGGGVYVSSGTPSIARSIFVGNTASKYGGAMSCGGAQVTDCAFVGNGAELGGGISAWGATDVANCTFFENRGHALFDHQNTSRLVNSIARGGEGDPVGKEPTILFSNVEGGTDEPHNIDRDPLFVDRIALSGVFGNVSDSEKRWQTNLPDDSTTWTAHGLSGLFAKVTSSVDGDVRWLYIADNTEDALLVPRLPGFLVQPGDTYRVFDLHLAKGSPCIDSGLGSDENRKFAVTAKDIEGNDRVDAESAENQGFGAPRYVDMGAYEHQP